MAEADIIQLMLTALGQSQPDRVAAGISRMAQQLDDRDVLQLIQEAVRLAGHLQYSDPASGEASGTWAEVLLTGHEDLPALCVQSDGRVPPHLGLLLVFLQLYHEFTQPVINELPKRHLDFQFQRILQFAARPGQPDHAHLLLELRKGIPSALVDRSDEFSGGRDSAGVERIYRPVRDVVINQSRVVQLRSICWSGVPGAAPAQLCFAPGADSADEPGTPSSEPQRAWPPFGTPDSPAAQIGFAVAAPVLRMAEGQRRIELTVDVSSLDPTLVRSELISQCFTASVTGPKGWILTKITDASATADCLRLRLELTADSPAVVDYDSKLHGHSLLTGAPVCELLLNPEYSWLIPALSRATVRRIRVAVEVRGLSVLQIENDQGRLDPKKTFLPFGPEPTVGSRFQIDSEEALSKRLTQLDIHIAWHNAPSNLTDWYEGYPARLRVPARFRSGSDERRFEKLRVAADSGVSFPVPMGNITADLNLSGQAGDTFSREVTLMQATQPHFTTLHVDRSLPSVVPEDHPFDVQLFAMLSNSGPASRRQAARMMLQQPRHQRQSVQPPTHRTQSISITLKNDFRHADYRRQTIQNALNLAGQGQPAEALNEPYTPAIRSLRMDYRATSATVSLDAETVESFATLEVQFFAVGCCGAMRDHAWLRSHYGFLGSNRVPLIPDYPHAGELLIGIENTGPGDSLSLLFEVAEGSANPDREAQPVSWSVLCENYWRPLSPTELTLDTTGGLRTSGLLSTSLPEEVTTEHTMLPSGLVWLRGTIPRFPDSVCRLRLIAANAVEVVLQNGADSSSHLATGLPPESITRLRKARSSVKVIRQPFSTRRGRAPETAEQMIQRASERLRHRNRCISAWDYERMILASFPEIHRVKCIPHSSPQSWFAPGHTLIVVVPDLRNRNAIDILRPRADTGTLDAVADFVRQHCSPHAVIHVSNPVYVPIRLDFRVRFRAGLPFAWYRQQLNAELTRAISPWAFDAQRQLEFGGAIYRSTLLNLVDQLPWVDFVTDFRMVQDDVDVDRSSVRPERPDAILVSVSQHLIREVREN